MIEMVIDQAQVDKIMQIPKDAGANAFGYFAQEVWRGFRIEAPVDHGRLAGSFMLERHNDFEYAIQSGVEYALAVAEGTGVYGPKHQEIVIKPKIKKCLHFIWQGMEVFAKEAHVQGMKPNPYHERAFQKGEDRIDEFIRRALREYGE